MLTFRKLCLYYSRLKSCNDNFYVFESCYSVDSYSDNLYCDDPLFRLREISSFYVSLDFYDSVIDQWIKLISFPKEVFENEL